MTLQRTDHSNPSDLSQDLTVRCVQTRFTARMVGSVSGWMIHPREVADGSVSIIDLMLSTLRHTSVADGGERCQVRGGR
jgi:hypothetical protein